MKDLENLLAAAWKVVEAAYPGFRLDEITLRLDNKAKMKIPVLSRSLPTIAKDDSGPNKHSSDLRSVTWKGVLYSFTAMQSAVVKQLWEAWEEGTPAIGQHTLLEGADSSSSQLRDLFKESSEREDSSSRMHLAWGVMIVSAGKGNLRLAD
jgi:hypothetical protein